jgi:hypothetical protein
MEHKKTFIPSEMDFLGVRQLWDAIEIRFFTVVALESHYSKIFIFFFLFHKINSSHRLHSH